MLPVSVEQFKSLKNVDTCYLCNPKFPCDGDINY